MFPTLKMAAAYDVTHMRGIHSHLLGIALNTGARNLPLSARAHAPQNKYLAHKLKLQYLAGASCVLTDQFAQCLKFTVVRLFLQLVECFSQDLKQGRAVVR
ncbi:hypothetical protein NDU88_007389 [Pleurodeles waltl]|uniref:Uncharacterized protein n=1 Tax=Pleurodeles waltl TaxID=8319 RepID=A0AAV7U083_PLEWA|nr:hypothetical protein NDU88_007389 [Pleurodeles waltl]